jgi:hypothetical protein
MAFDEHIKFISDAWPGKFIRGCGLPNARAKHPILIVQVSSLPHASFSNFTMMGSLRISLRPVRTKASVETPILK